MKFIRIFIARLIHRVLRQSMQGAMMKDMHEEADLLKAYTVKMIEFKKCDPFAEDSEAILTRIGSELAEIELKLLRLEKRYERRIKLIGAV